MEHYIKDGGANHHPEYRKLYPLDLGLAGYGIPALSSYTVANWINHTCTQYLCIYKLSMLADYPCVSTLIFRAPVPEIMDLSEIQAVYPLLRAVKTVDEVDRLQHEYGLENLQPEGWFSEPYILRPGNKLVVDVATTREASSSDKIALIGFTLTPEKEG